MYPNRFKLAVFVPASAGCKTAAAGAGSELPVRVAETVETYSKGEGLKEGERIVIEEHGRRKNGR